MPGEGKSGNWRRADLRLSVRLASSAEGEGPVAASPLWAAWWSLEVSVGSGELGGGCDEVDGLEAGEGSPDMIAEEKGRRRPGKRGGLDKKKGARQGSKARRAGGTDGLCGCVRNWDAP